MAFFQGGGRFFNQTPTVSNLSLTQYGNVSTQVFASIESPIVKVLRPNDSATDTRFVIAAPQQYPRGCKFILLHLMCSWTNGNAVASLPVINPVVQITITATPNKIYTYPISNTIALASTYWGNACILIPVDRLQPSLQYAVSLISQQSSTSAGATSASFSNVNVVGAYVSYVS